MTRRNAGFTLVELMIAIAIVSILASIAIPSYVGYLAKAKTTGGKSELGGLRINYENQFNDGNSSPSLEGIGANTVSSSHCSFALTNNQDGSATLACTLLNPPSPVSGGVVSFLRSSTGAWTCQVNAAIGTTYAPNGCTVGS